MEAAAVCLAAAPTKTHSPRSSSKTWTSPLTSARTAPASHHTQFANSGKATVVLSISEAGGHWKSLSCSTLDCLVNALDLLVSESRNLQQCQEALGRTHPPPNVDRTRSTYLPQLSGLCGACSDWLKEGMNQRRHSFPPFEAPEVLHLLHPWRSVAKLLSSLIT